jgi:Caspase domain
MIFLRKTLSPTIFYFIFLLTYLSSKGERVGPGPDIGGARNKVYVISIGLSGNSQTFSKTGKFTIYSGPCPVCLTDAAGFPAYLKKLAKHIPYTIDSIIAYQYVNKDINIDTLYKAFIDVQKQAQPDDIFVFYYAGFNWGSIYNEEGRSNEGFYSINNKLVPPDNGNHYSFTLRILKALTDRIAANRQLIIFDTGHGDVIEADYYKNFFSDNPTVAYFTKKNRIVICPEYVSSDSWDEKEKVVKGDMFKVISNLPDTLNVFTLFDTSMYSKASKNSDYKLFMKAWYDLQLGCAAQIKILKELDYLRLLTDIKTDKIGFGKRGGEVLEDEKQGDSSFISFAKRKKKALIVATNEYDASSTWAHLRNPINDGIAIGNILQKDYGYDVKTLFNMSYDSIMAAINELCQNEDNPYNQYIIYFAGHGFYNQLMGSYIVCRNSNPIKDFAKPEWKELDSCLNYTILFQHINASLNKVILITDVCYGGNAFKSLPRFNTSVNPENERHKLKNPFKKFLASGVIPVSDFIKQQNGVSDNSPFASALLDILKNKKDYLNFEGLVSEIKNKPLSASPIEFTFGTEAMPNEFIF